MLTRSEEPNPWGLRSVVLPMCGGKSLLAQTFGGYDVDDLVVNTDALGCDDEFDDMVGAREDGLIHGMPSRFSIANQIMVRRCKRMFRVFSGDSNAKILYVHTVEAAMALGAPPIFVGNVSMDSVASTPRMQELGPEMRRLQLGLIQSQIGANRTYCERHGITYNGEMESFELLTTAIRSVITKEGLVVWTGLAAVLHHELIKPARYRETLELAYSMVRNPSLPSWVRAVAARRVWLLVGDSTPQEAQQHHNHHVWARVVAAACQHYSGALPPIPDFTEDEWCAQFPYGPGNSKFALARISDWIEETGLTNMTTGYDWFRQLLLQTDCSYERALCTLVMGDVWSYVAPQHAELANRLPMGSLSPLQYAEVTKSLHAVVRSSCTFLGQKLEVRDLAVFTYWDCIAGRYMGTGDIPKEIADRTSQLPQKVYIMPDGTKSHEQFNVYFAEAVNDVLRGTLREGVDRLLKHKDLTVDFNTFMDYRKRWVRPGSVTGGPKTDIYLRVVGERETAIREVADDLHTMSMYVLNKVRLNKAATFEFAEFPALVKSVLKDYVPSSFTRHFIKNEIAKLKGRALFPSHVTHYTVGSYVLYLLMKGAPVDHVRLVPDEAVARDEHWMWQQARDFTVGLMLDYENFNESHEFEDMKVVIGSLKNLYSEAYMLSPDMRAMIDWVCDAYDETLFEYEGELHRFLHGMLSGQAPTSMINSVINASNKRVVRKQMHTLYGEAVLTKRTSGGDDVAAETYDLSMSVLTVKVGTMMNFAFKESKQLISSTYYEFFRLFVSSDGVYGSLPRALGSLCSGQWSNSIKAKFVDPASKLGSVVEIARKAGRRAGGNTTFMEKICYVAFKKWATFGEARLTEAYIHGRRQDGGLGIPRPDGSICVSEIVPAPEGTNRVEITGIPMDASMTAATQTVKQAVAIMGPAACTTPERLARSMAEAVFMGNVAAMEGVGVAQLLSNTRPPLSAKITRTMNFPREGYAGLHSDVYRRDYAIHKEECDRYASAGARYDGLAGAVLPEQRPQLARILATHMRVDGAKLYWWKEKLTLYGCGTYLLTEDYYGSVQRLAIVTASEATDESISERLAMYAAALANDEQMDY